MSCVARSLCFVAVLVSLSRPAIAQDRPLEPPPSPMTPSEPHERMTFFQGAWARGDSVYLGGRLAESRPYTETCDWLEGGRRHMVCRGVDETPAGPRTLLSVMSYREADSTYVVHLAFSSGETLTYHGRIKGDAWLLDMQPHPLVPPGLRYRSIIRAVDGGLRFVEEQREDGAPPDTTEDYRHRRVPLDQRLSQDVTALAESVLAAASARDATWFASHFSDRADFRYAINLRVLRSRAELEEAFTAMLGRQAEFRPVWTDRHVQPLGADRASFTGAFETRARTTEGEFWRARGIVTFVAERTPEGWRIVSWHTSEAVDPT